jgi:hypothetical protein
LYWLRIAFTSDRKGNRDIFARKTGGVGEETLLDSSDDEWIEDWSRDGRYIAYGMNPRAGEAGDIYALPLFGDRKPIPVVRSPANDDEPRFSFDGNWLAYSNRAYADYLKKRFDEADADLDIALAINPNAKQMPQIRGMMNERRLRGRLTTYEHQ